MTREISVGSVSAWTVRTRPSFSTPQRRSALVRLSGSMAFGRASCGIGAQCRIFCAMWVTRMIRLIVRTVGVWLFTSAGHAADAPPEIALRQLPVLAQVLKDGVVDLDHAVVGSPDLCDKNAAFVDSLKAQILLQIFGNFTLERVVSDSAGATPPAYPPPFHDRQGAFGLKDRLRISEPMRRP